jgi:TolA-binding protein
VNRNWFLTICVAALVAAPPAGAQAPPRAASPRAEIEDAARWIGIGSYHVARQKLEQALARGEANGQDRDVLFLLMESSYEDRDYEESFQWAAEFLSEYAADGERGTALLMKGVSAYQIRQIREARESLTLFLDEEPASNKRGAAFFWRAMCAIEQGDWASSESDIQHCFDDSSSNEYRDNALMGWALSLERRGEFSRAAEYLDRLVSEYPGSELMTDARIRQASVALRRGDDAGTLRYLEQVDPSTPRQREETLFLRAEARYHLGRYDAAHDDYEELYRVAGDDGLRKAAHYGIAWSKLKRGDAAGAQVEFDALSAKGKDSLAYAAMYQGSVLALLQQNTLSAMARFDSLTQVSPYDQFAERSYYQMGLIQYRMKRYKEARRYFQLAARLFPDSPHRAEAYRMSGEASVALSDFSNAQYAFAQVRRLGISPELIPGAMFQEGVALYHLGRFKTSADLFADLLRRYPSDARLAEIYLWRGEALYQDGRYADAEKSYSDALRLQKEGPHRATASYGIAWTLFEQKKFSQAAAAFDRFATQFPNDEHVLDASLRKADCYFFMGDYEKSSALYAALAEDKGGSRQAEYAAFQLGMSYIQRGESERGVTHLRNFLMRFPSSVYNEVVQFNIGWTYFSKDQFPEALTEFRVVMRDYPQSQLMPRVLFNTGDAFYNMKQYDSARVYYQRVLKEYPETPLVPDAMSGLQYTYEAEGRPAAGLAEIDTLLRATPAGSSQEELLLRKGDILFGQADFGGAVLEYQKLLAMKPAKPVEAKALYQLGRAYELENNPQQAMPYYERLRRDFPDAEVAPTAALALGLAQIKTKQYTAAVGVLTEFERRYADSPLLAEVRYNRGVALSLVPQPEEAKAQFQALLQNNAADIFAERSRLQIARLAIKKKEYKAALDTLNALVSRRNDDLAAEGLLLIGECYVANKKTVDALQAFKDVYEQYSEFPLMVERARFAAGECYERLRDIPHARQAYEAVVNSAVDPVMRKDAQERLKRLRR